MFRHFSTLYIKRLTKKLFKRATQTTHLVGPKSCKTKILNENFFLHFCKNIVSFSCFFFTFTAQKMTFSIKEFFSKCDQIRNFQRIWSHLLKKSLMQNIIFCAVIILNLSYFLYYLYYSLHGASSV